MALKILDAGTLRTITRLWIRQAGVLRRIRTLKVQDGGTLRTVATFADPLTVTAFPPTVSGSVSSTGPAQAITNATLATPSGGFAPYTYLWELQSGVGSAVSPTMASTRFRHTLEPSDATGVFLVTVTDSLGQTATATVNAVFTNSGDFS